MTAEPIHVSHPARKILRFIETTSGSPHALSPARQDEWFGELALELYRWQFEHNESYRRLAEARKLIPATVRRWSEIPPVPTAAFKEFPFSCLTPDERTTVFHSSGTSRQKPSCHYHSVVSLELYHASLLPWFRRHFPAADGGLPLVSLTPPPRLAPRSSLVHMLDVVRAECMGRDAWFAGGIHDDGSWQLDPGDVTDRLQRHIALNQPVLVAGTAFNFVHLGDAMMTRDLRLQLPPGSAVMETGGYKGRSRTLSRSELHDLISDRLGVPPEHIVCEYGMCELSSQAYDRTAGAPDRRRVFRLPPWARARIVSAEDGSEVSEGQVGILQVFDLANVFSVMAIQTEDLAMPRNGGFELVGRAVEAEPRGCSLLPT